MVTLPANELRCFGHVRHVPLVACGVRRQCLRFVCRFTGGRSARYVAGCEARALFVPVPAQAAGGAI